MSPVSRGRKGARRPVKRSREKRQDPFEAILRHAVTLGSGTRLGAQLAASAWLAGPWAAGKRLREDVELTVVEQLVELTHGSRPRAAWLALHALATVPGESWRDVVADALETCPAEVVPAWAVDPRRYAPEPPVGAQLWADPWESNVIHVLDFDEPVPHSLLVSESRVGGRMAQVLGTAPREEREPPEGLSVVERDPVEAAADVAELLWRTDLYWPVPDDPDYTMERALVHWRTRHLRVDREREPLGDDERAVLIDDFLDGLGLDLGRDLVRLLADTFVDFGDGYLEGGVLAWSPGEVERFMLDWVHRKVLLEPEATDVLPVVLAAWVTFVLDRRGLAAEHVQEAVATVFDCEDEYRELLVSGAARGPAAEIAARMRDAGIDPDDKAGVDRIIGEYNAEMLARRLIEE